MKTSLTDEQREKQMAKSLWLNYFNRYLFEHRVIAEREYKMIAGLIAAWR